MAALLCLGLAPAVSAACEASCANASRARGGGAQPQLAEQDVWRRWELARAARAGGTAGAAAEGAPTRTEKASGLLGMAVRNSKGEYLGRIKDVVFDWQSQQVSYAVISTARKGPLGAEGKWLAVPPAALTASPDQDHLVLKTEKSEVATAQRLDRDNWPSASNPSWGAGSPGQSK